MRRQIDNSILEMALVGYSAKRNEVVEKMADIQRQLGGRASASATIQTAEPKLKHHISAAGRARIAEAQRRRWAASKSAESPAPPTPELSKPRRKLSKAGRAAIVAATKKRKRLNCGHPPNRLGEVLSGRPDARSGPNSGSGELRIHPVKRRSTKWTIPRLFESARARCQGVDVPSPNLKTPLPRDHHTRTVWRR